MRARKSPNVTRGQSASGKEDSTGDGGDLLTSIEMSVVLQWIYVLECRSTAYLLEARGAEHRPAGPVQRYNTADISVGSALGRVALVSHCKYVKSI